jgi:hypothetical protein
LPPTTAACRSAEPAQAEGDHYRDREAPRRRQGNFDPGPSRSLAEQDFQNKPQLMQELQSALGKANDFRRSATIRRWSEKLRPATDKKRLRPSIPVMTDGVNAALESVVRRACCLYTTAKNVPSWRCWRRSKEISESRCVTRPAEAFQRRFLDLGRRCADAGHIDTRKMPDSAPASTCL